MGVEEWMMKIAAKKIEYYEVGWLFFDVYGHVAKSDGADDGSRSMQ